MTSSTPSEPNSTTPLTCIDCGAPVEQTLAGIAICDDCLSTRGACCQEFGAVDLTKEETKPRAYNSPACAAHLFEEADAIQHITAEHRFYTASGARLDYVRLATEEIKITHTFVPKHLRGKGIAAQLMQAAIQYADQARLQVSASCDYAQVYLKRYRS